MPEMRYVERKGGKVVAHYAHPHKYATECIPADHPDIVEMTQQRADALKAEREKYSVVTLEARITALEQRLLELGGK